MSGFEIAGVVLAIFPLCISALEDYKSGKSKASAFLKWGTHLDNLIFRLKTQHFNYRLNAMLVLRSAGIGDLSDKDEETCVALLRDSQTGQQMNDYLGPLSIHYREVIQRYEKCLKEIVASLRKIKRIPKASNDDLQAVLDANPSKNGRFAFKQRLDFTLERGRLKALLEELKEDNLTLETITRGMRAMYEPQPETTSRESIRLLQSFERIRGLACRLDKAVACGWIPGCHPQHEAMMHLDPRLPNMQMKTLLPEQVCFEMFFFSSGGHQSRQLWHGASILTVDEEPWINPAVLQVSQNNRIANMCLAVKEARQKKKRLRMKLIMDSLHISPDERILSQQVSDQQYSEHLSFEDFLASTSANEDLQLAFKQRTLIALSIACSILQLHNTKWHTRAWTKKHISFFIKGHARVDIDTDRPVISQTLHNAAPSTPPTPQNVTVKEALLELAILLLEIWHHEPMEAWSSNTGNTYNDTFDGRRSAAIRWLEMSTRKLPLNHLSAIEACLQFCAGRLRDWDDIEWRKQMCEGVIKPLKENCKTW